MLEGPKPARFRRRRLRLVVAACVCVLVSALFAAPATAEIDFGHDHPDETCPHVHELDSVLARAASTTVELGEGDTPRPFLIDSAEGQVALTESVYANPIRGPPRTFLS